VEKKLKLKQEITSRWFREIRDLICRNFEEIEQIGSKPLTKNSNSKRFKKKKWKRAGGGGGEMSVMYGEVFEKVGVNISCVHGEFSEEFKSQIPGAEKNGKFWAAGISVVVHPNNPHVPSAHMNTRFISTSKNWFGGGCDLTPVFSDKFVENSFHSELKNCCDGYDLDCYEKFRNWCHDYFFIKHRNEHRGIGGIFFDYLNSGNFELDFDFIKNVGMVFNNSYSKIVLKNMKKKWSDEEKDKQLLKRGRYVEFNLMYDRGTKFGLQTGGNIEAILMSLPPKAKW